MNRRVAATGAAVLVVYVVVVVASGWWRSDGTRPLYDGFVPPSSYRWVDPPSFFSSNNVRPVAKTATVAFDANGSAPAGIATSDGQFVVAMAAGAVRPVAGETAFDVSITPLAPKKLAPLPQGLRADGNAYRFEVGGPSSDVVNDAATREFAAPVTLVVELPEVGTQLFRSVDNGPWTPVAAEAFGPNKLSLRATLTAPGTYVAATNLPELVAPTTRSRSHTSLIVGVIVVVLALAAFAVAFAMARRGHGAPRTPPQ